MCIEQGIKYEGFYVREGKGGINESMVERTLLRIVEALQKSSIISSENSKIKS